MTSSDCSTSYSSACASASASASSSNKQNLSSMPDRDFNYVPCNASDRAVAKGGVACPFPWRLHEMLKVSQEEGLEHIVSWAPHGKAFTVHRPQEFAERIMPRFFCQTKFASFQRQLNLYGFARFCHGRDKGAYYHSCFIRGQRALVRQMIRRKIKGTSASLRRPLPTEEPNFYQDEYAQESTPAASPVPPYISYQSNNNTHSISQVQDEQSLAFLDDYDDNLAFFDGSPFHVVQDEATATTETVVPPVAATRPSLPLDPAAELAKIRAQIRQKQEEYERTVGRRHELSSFTTAATTTATSPRRVSWQQEQQQPLRGNNSSRIPVYNSSYIAV